MKPTRPILRFMGGKWMLAPWIIEHLPDHRVYVEPFGGGASVLLRKERSYAEVYNDIDEEIVNLFAVTRNHGTELRGLLRLTPFSRNEFMMSYEQAYHPIEQARRTVIKAFMGFGCNSHNVKSGFRADSNKSGSTPAHDWKTYPAALDAIIERLQGVVLENRDAWETMQRHDSPKTLHYVDPPYPHTTRGKNRYRYEMSDEDHEQLAERLATLKGMVVLSGYRCELMDRLYADWPRVDKHAWADGARPRTESLWFRNIKTQQTLI